MSALLSPLLYYVVLKPMSLLPMWCLYGLSDVLFIFLFYLTPYRKKVVFDNLRLCFPEKNEAEIKRIARSYYRHLADLIVESIKNFSISAAQAARRMRFTNPEVLNDLADQGRGIVLCGGHYGNWELWAVAAGPVMHHEVVGIYKPLSNAFLNRKMLESRGRFGLSLVPTRSAGEYMRKTGTRPRALVLAFDQNPPNVQKSVWVHFMGRPTAAYFGAERYSRELGLAVVYGRIVKVKRGHYECTAEVLHHQTAELPQGQVIQQLFDLLEAEIRKAPEYWLWSHRRWKHKPPADGPAAV